jgi:CheY-like chemotaxis protein
MASGSAEKRKQPDGCSNMLQGEKILIIEDDEAAAESIEVLCRSLGHRPIVAHDGITGLEMASSEKPRLILSDIAMPGLDGFEVARQVRNNHDLDHTAVVAVTGYAPRQPAANQKTFDDYVMKPFSVDHLGRIISKYCPPPDESAS